ncbi:hypothetical protein GCM10007920_46260 [Ciceribacter naphthalenivorans]|uniref:Uncharacterized protein n=2 Tax=Alphaproteobacteria TaxID=28211 RepID=A0A512HFR5_9HYPH|nr:hypothetical protein RNA01_12280 [Ciceribacter naphthalenivorans]GLR24832.1 hypothetical protein GCM10007920_46260 [Ciceribacter naphthalenivorans]GLT07688.1 hypothetical protein GCM10007926_46260 [Sphingomonas psychrolutea]
MGGNGWAGGSSRLGGDGAAVAIKRTVSDDGCVHFGSTVCERPTCLQRKTPPKDEPICPEVSVQIGSSPGEAGGACVAPEGAKDH